MAPLATLIRQSLDIKLYEESGKQYLTVADIAKILKVTLVTLTPLVNSAPNNPKTLLDVPGLGDTDCISNEKLPGLLSSIARPPSSSNLISSAVDLLRSLSRKNFSLTSFVESYAGSVVSFTPAPNANSGGGGVSFDIETLDDRVAALIQVAGSLTKSYDDANGILTLTGGGGGGAGAGAPVSVPFSTTPTLTNLISVSSSNVTTPLNFTAPSNGIAGAGAYTRLVADGVLANTPTFSGFKQLLGSSGWDNRAGIANLIQWVYDGADYFYTITQAIGAIPTDTVAPNLVSSALNGAKNKLTLTYSEPLSGTVAPSQYTATGMTITAASIVSNSVELTLSPAVVGGTALTLAYTGNTIKDVANNIAPTFAAQSISNLIGGTFFSNRAATLTEANDVYTGSGAGAWGNVGVTATANFIGAKTLTAKIGGVENAMLWIDATGDLADYSTGDYGVFRNGLVAYRTLINGVLAVIPVIVPVADSEVRLVRNASNNLRAEYSNNAGSTWTLLWDFGTIAATPFFCKMASNVAPVSKVALT